MNKHRNSTECEFDNFNIRFQLEQQIQNQQTKESGWYFESFDSMTLNFYKTTEKNCINYMKKPLRTSTKIFFENDFKTCFLLSTLAGLHPCKTINPYRVSKYRQYSDELNLQRFDFTNGFNCSDVFVFENSNNLSLNFFELSFYQDKSESKQRLKPIEKSKNESEEFFDCLISTHHFALIKGLLVFSGKLNFSFFYRRCLSSYSCQNVLLKDKQCCSQQEITSIGTSNACHLY